MPRTHDRARTVAAARTISCVAGLILRLGLVVPLAWIGLQKFTSEEADAIVPLIDQQPLMSWLYDIFSVQALSNVLGSVEILAAILIAARPLSALAAALGSGVAVLLFLSTLSFIVTTPGVVADSSLHVPLLTDTGGFLIKDIALLGAAAWALGDALRAVGSTTAGRPATAG